MNKKIIKSIFTIAFMVIFLGLFTTCFSDYGADIENLTINMGGNARSALPWPKDNPDILKDIILEIYLEGNGETKTIDAKGTDTISTTVSSGFWSVSITAYYKSNTFLYAYGVNEIFEVKTGQKNTVTVEMYKKHYNIGDDGPGGGKIFYVNPEGFTVQGLEGNEEYPGFSSYTAHYLEVSTENILNSDESNPTWGDFGTEVEEITTFTSSTDQLANKIGNGRKDTMLIVAHMNGADETETAAQLAVDYKASPPYDDISDWFLPSLGELYLLYQNRDDVGMETETSYFWSSSQYNSNYAWNVNFSNGNRNVSSKSSTVDVNVRAVRAF